MYFHNVSKVALKRHSVQQEAALEKTRDDVKIKLEPRIIICNQNHGNEYHSSEDKNEVVKSLIRLLIS